MHISLCTYFHCNVAIFISIITINFPKLECRFLIPVGLPIAEDACTWLLASVECTTPVICDVGISAWGLAGAMVWISYKENKCLKSETETGGNSSHK